MDEHLSGPPSSAAWHDLTTVPEPSLASVDDLDTASPEVVVVGLGASGLEAVAALAARGVDVVGLDASGIAAGAAGANGGFLLAGLAMFHHDAVAALGRDVAGAWYRRTQVELDRLEETEPTFRRVGSLRTAAAEDEFVDIRAHLGALAADGIPAVPYDGPLGRGLIVTGDGAIDPVARCRRLAAEAIDDGALLVSDALVERVAPGAVTIAGRDEPLRPRGVLVAIDGGLERLVPELAGRVRTARLQMLATAADEGVTLERPLYHRGGLDYAQQLATGEVLLGGGRDIEGERSWGAPAVPTDDVQDHLDGWASQLGVTAPVTHRWAAHAAWTDDLLPIDERIDVGVHVVGAYSGHGNVLGGLLAREAAVRLLEDV